MHFQKIGPQNYDVISSRLDLESLPWKVLKPNMTSPPLPSKN